MILLLHINSQCPIISDHWKNTTCDITV